MLASAQVATVEGGESGAKRDKVAGMRVFGAWFSVERLCCLRCVAAAAGRKGHTGSSEALCTCQARAAQAKWPLPTRWAAAEPSQVANQSKGGNSEKGQPKTDRGGYREPPELKQGNERHQTQRRPKIANFYISGLYDPLGIAVEHRSA